MKTKPFKHQEEGERRLLAAPEYYALGAEQGTGKTWMLLNDMEHQFKSGRITGALVIAPKGVHVNWVTREIPEHLSIPVEMGFWLSGAGKRHMARLERLLRLDPGDELVVLTINVDAVNTKKGFEFAQKFLRKFRSMIIVDESQRIKNPAAKRSQRVCSLAPFAASRRIASGTLVANTPLDLFGQFEFLCPGLLGTTSFRAFTAQYAELLPANHRLVQEIRQRNGARGNPQIIARDKEGRMKFKNLDKLQALLAPHTFRVLKKDCLDLPEKIYQILPYELSPKQRRLHDFIKEEKRYERDDGEIDIFSALTVIGKLQQVTSGFIMVDGEATTLDEDEAKPRIDALMTAIDGADPEGKIIIWCQFQEEIRSLSKLLRKDGREVVEYYGPTSGKDREVAVDSFQNGDAEIFLATRAAETGLTLTAASTVIYYSWGYSLEGYLQSQDRAHRIGTKRNVVYINIVARNTIDERVAKSLQAKEEIAASIMDGL